MEEQCKKISEENYKKDILSKYLSIKKYINEYNRIVDLLINHKVDRAFVDVNVKSLLENQKNLSIYKEIFKDEGFNLQLLRYSTCKEERIQTNIGYDTHTLILQSTCYKPRYHYLFPNEYLIYNKYRDFECYVYDNKFINYILVDFDERHQNIKKYDDEIKKIIKNHTTKLINIPKLVFGDKYINSDEFTSLFDKLLKNLNEFNEKFIKPLQLNKFANDSIYFIEEIRSNVNNALKCLKAKFSDGSPTDINKFVFKPLLEFIFTPNLSTQKVLSRTGTEFDITALIFNLINPVPDPLIYLEQKGGLIRNYGISIVIDASRSCFNPLSACHSYKTIEILFSALSLIDVPCIDVIIATDNEPIILCSEVPSMRLLNEKSQFWISLFKCLYNSSYDKCNLESAIHAAYDIRKIGYINPTCYMFVLTDGLYENEQKQVIKNHLMTCQHSGISIFGIGIGIYPRGIIDMFPNIIFATNPNYLIHGIASFFGNQTVESYNDSIKHLTPDPPKFETLSTVFKELNKFIEKPIFIDLKQHLAKTPHALGIKGNVSKLGANVTGVLRFSIQWNDVGDWDNNDLYAHCIEPNGHRIYFHDRIDKNTGGNLDVDITDPQPNEPACENITWPDINKMLNGKYQFLVNQFAYRKGQSGFRAEIEFNGFSYFYDYKKPLDTNKENVYVADVTLQDGHFTIHHKLDFY